MTGVQFVETIVVWTQGVVNAVWIILVRVEGFK